MKILHTPKPETPWLHVSRRLHFQLYYTNQTPHRAEDKVTNVIDMNLPTPLEYPNILNVGCSDDPLGLLGAAVHYDMDDWSQVHEFFVQGDAHNIVLPENSFHTVLLGDILEHCIDPWKVISEACRVSSKLVVATVFSEWRFGKHGFDPKLGQKLSDQDSQELGYKDREDAQRVMFPKRVGVDDTEHPHLCHVWQFNASHIDRMLATFEANGFEIKFFELVPEVMYSDGHEINNWLISAERHNE